MPGGTCGYARSAQKGAVCGQALCVGFIAVKLEQGVGHRFARTLDVLGAGVDEQQHRGDERWQAKCQLSRALRRDVARALVLQHKAHRIRTGVGGRIHIGLSREAADLDSGAVGGRGQRHQGNQSKAEVRSGNAQASS